MVLCAGFGTRLGDLTREVPKPMLLLQGRPLLEYIVRHLARHGFDQIVINLHFMPKAIRDYFGEGVRWNVSLTYSYEQELLGTAGAIKKMEQFFQGEPFLVQYGDVLTDQDFAEMLDFHIKRQSLATVLLHQRANSNSIVSMERDGRIVGFLERPTPKERRGVGSPWVNSGILICNAELLSEIPANRPCDLPRDIYPKLVSSGRLYGYPLAGYRCAIDSPKRLDEARLAIADNRCRIQVSV